MTLTIADVERWDAGDVREVFHAASDRAQAAQDAADGIATLPALSTWGGKAAEAAIEAITTTGEQLKAHSAEVRAVARAARTAANEIERLKSELATLKSDAAALEMEIDPTTNQVVPGPAFKGTATESLLKQQQLQPRVDKLLAEATFVDVALAGAITRADGSVPNASTPEQQPPTPPGQGGPLVQAAREVPAQPGGQGAPGTWQEMMLPTGAAEVGAGAPNVAPTLQDLLFPPGTPPPGPPASVLDRVNAARREAGRALLNPRADPEFMAEARDLLAKQGIPADQIDQHLDSLIDMMDQPVADYVPPERSRQPAPGFEDGFRDSWFANEQFLKSLVGQAGPGAPGVLESWGHLAQGLHETVTDPVGTVRDEIDRALNSPSGAYYAGGWAADISQSAAAGPFLGPEALAGRTALRGVDVDVDVDVEHEVLDYSPRAAMDTNGGSSLLSPDVVSPQPLATSPTSLGPHPLPLDSPLFDDYQPTPPGPDFTKSDGQLVYPDSSQPSKPYAVPGTIVDHVQLPQGTVIDRFGSPFGSWLAPDDTPFSHRALPPRSSRADYFRYVIDNPASLPPGFKIEQSQAAPWFHQPGHGVQFRIIGPDGNDAPVTALLESGYLRDADE